MRVAVAWTHLQGLFLITVVGLLVTSLPAHAAPRAGLEPGDLVVGDQDAGQVLRVPSEGSPEVMLSGLGSVAGVAVLADGAVLAADTAAGTVVGTGGRYGDGAVKVACGLVSPRALAVAGPETVYVTSLTEGTLSRIDLETGQVDELGTGLDGPSAVAEFRSGRRTSQLLVAESFAGTVGALGRDGRRSGTLVEGLGRPAGLAVGPGGTVYIADRRDDRVLAVSRAGRERVVAEVDAPSGLSLDPAVPSTGQAFDLIVTTADGVRRVDPETGATSVVARLGSGTGVATAPAEFLPEEVSGGAVDGEPVASVRDSDVDPATLGLILLAVVLAGMALVGGAQLVRNRGDDDAATGDVREGSAQGSRKERRAARRSTPAGAASDTTEPNVGAAVVDGSTRHEPDPTPQQGRAAAKAAKKAEAARARSDAKEAKAAARRDKAAAKAARKAGGETAEGIVVEDDGATEATGAWMPVAPDPVQPDEAVVVADRPDLPPPDLGRLPLFAVSTPPSPTAGPFLSSLFSEGAIAEPEPAPVTGQGSVPPAPRGEPTPSEPEIEPATEAVSEGSVQNDLVELVGRPGPVLRGLGGRRRARRRRRAAERRHDHLRALGQLNVMPLPVPPEVPPSPEVLGPSRSDGETTWS